MGLRPWKEKPILIATVSSLDIVASNGLNMRYPPPHGLTVKDVVSNWWT